MRHALRRAVLLLAVGMILFIFSERMFWSIWRPDDDIVSFTGGWLLYSFLGYLLLTICRVFQVGDLAALFLAGACFGWLDEGVVAMTLFGDPSLPFPLTIAWTGLAWHALITVVVGLYSLRRCMGAQRIWPTIALSASVGIFWGVWGAGWLAETPPVGATPLALLVQTSGATVALVIAEMVLGPAGLAAFQPSAIGMVVACLLVAAFLGLVTVPALPYAPLVLVPLFALLFLALRRGRGRAGHDVLSVIAAIRGRNVIGLAAMPATATMSYLALGGVGAVVPIHLIIALAMTAAGFACVFVAFSKMMLTAPGSAATRAMGSP